MYGPRIVYKHLTYLITRPLHRAKREPRQSYPDKPPYTAGRDGRGRPQTHDRLTVHRVVGGPGRTVEVGTALETSRREGTVATGRLHSGTTRIEYWTPGWVPSPGMGSRSFLSGFDLGADSKDPSLRGSVTCRSGSPPLVPIHTDVSSLLVC